MSLDRIAIDFRVNGAPVSVTASPMRRLSGVLRDELGLTGTKIGCDAGDCGACTVLVDGKPVKSCTMLAIQAQGAAVTTIEGLARDGELHPMQLAFRKHHGLQCGFCTPGMVLLAVGLAGQGRQPTEAQIREALDGNFCRCTGYHNIVKAVQEGLAEMATA
jgi:carbon-monoxide dehydrogenase small subunit